VEPRAFIGCLRTLEEERRPLRSQMKTVDHSRNSNSFPFDEVRVLVLPVIPAKLSCPAYSRGTHEDMKMIVRSGFPVSPSFVIPAKAGMTNNNATF
jgi:hypothetical protein